MDSLLDASVDDDEAEAVTEDALDRIEVDDEEAPETLLLETLIREEPDAATPELGVAMDAEDDDRLETPPDDDDEASRSAHTWSRHT